MSEIVEKKLAPAPDLTSAPALASTAPIEGRSSNDTLRLWDGYKEKAFLWRGFALIQIPATAIMLVAAMVFFVTADITIDVPAKPEPGTYSVKELPDAHFISVATSVVNLISSYQPFTARSQFIRARRYLLEPALSDFHREFMKKKLPSVEEMSRSQLFFIDPARVRVERINNYVVVKLPGARRKFFQNKALGGEQVAWYVKMTTIPRNLHNEYGIVVTDLKIENVASGAASSREEARKGATPAGPKAVSQKNSVGRGL